MSRLLSSRRVFASILLGVLLVQAGWMLAIPAFRGSDEFDHVFKAAAVARGQWTAKEPALHGRGGIVTVPADLVSSASRVCEFYDYTGPDNCHPITPVGDGTVTVATAANAYNPVYYLLVGTLARPFHGATADLVMRVATALVCALLIAWAAAISARWATTSWPLLTLVVGLTPVLLYSTAIAAPNGITFAASVLLWSALLALARDPAGAGSVAAICLAIVALVSTHTSGFIWLALIGVIAIILVPARAWLQIVRRRLRLWLPALLIMAVATVLCALWVVTMHTNSPSGSGSGRGAFPPGRLAESQLLWLLQAIAAIPLRNDPAPAAVYVIWALLLGGVLVVLFRHGATRERTAAGLMLTLLVILPTALTIATYAGQGVAWQGRYGLPLWLGLTALAGAVMDRSVTDPRPVVSRAFFAVCGGTMAFSAVHVVHHEVAHGPERPAAADFTGGVALAALLMLAGYAIIAAARPRPLETIPVSEAEYRAEQKASR